MYLPGKDVIDALKNRFPVGCRVQLDRMENEPHPIPVGTQGTVQGVDDTGAIIVAWDTGSRLNVLYGIDECHKV